MHCRGSFQPPHPSMVRSPYSANYSHSVRTARAGRPMRPLRLWVCTAEAGGDEGDWGLGPVVFFFQPLPAYGTSSRFLLLGSWVRAQHQLMPDPLTCPHTMWYCYHFKAPQSIARPPSRPAPLPSRPALLSQQFLDTPRKQCMLCALSPARPRISDACRLAPNPRPHPDQADVVVDLDAVVVGPNHDVLNLGVP